MTGGVYVIGNTINRKVYFGSSVSVRKRLIQHKSQLKHGVHPNNHLQHSFNKYGEKAFVFKILEFISRKNIRIREQYYIDKYKSYFSDKGYNNLATTSSNVSATQTESANIKRSETLKEFWTSPKGLAYRIIQMKKRPNFSGMNHPNCKLSDEAVKDIVYRHQSTNEPVSSIADRYGVCASTVSKIALGRRRSYGTSENTG